jgi:hypothetical protein
MNFENDCTVYRTRFLVRACQLKEPLAFTDALGREHSGAPGDYLVESFEGCFRITARHIFEDIYVPLSPENPHDGQQRQAVLERAVCALSPWSATRSPAMNRQEATPEPGSCRNSGANRTQVPVWSG